VAIIEKVDRWCVCCDLPVKFAGGMELMLDFRVASGERRLHLLHCGVLSVRWLR
jgi:hypothetical protein